MSKKKLTIIGASIALLVVAAIIVIAVTRPNSKPSAKSSQYTDSKTGFKITPPKGWTVPKKVPAGLIVEFESTASTHPKPTISVIGTPAKATLSQYIKAISANNAKEFTGYKEIGGKELTVDGVPAAILEYSALVDSFDLHYSELVIIKSGAFYQVTGTTTAAGWTSNSRQITDSLKSVKLL
jgi:hypothetical protein